MGRNWTATLQVVWPSSGGSVTGRSSYHFESSDVVRHESRWPIGEGDGPVHSLRPPKSCAADDRPSHARQQEPLAQIHAGIP